MRGVLKPSYSKQNVYTFTRAPERIRVPKLKTMTVAEMGALVDKYFGVGKQRSKAIVSTILDVFEEALETGRPFPISRNVIVAPYIVTEDVKYYGDHKDILQVVKQHVTYGLYTPKKKIGCYELPKTEYYLRSTSVPLPIEEIHKLTIKDNYKKYRRSNEQKQA